MQSTELETQQLINSLNTALVMVDSKLTIVYANHAGEALFETGLKQLIGHPLQDFFLPGTIESTRLKAAIRKGEDFTENEIKLAFRDNRYVSADLTVTNLHIDNSPRLLFEVKKIDQQKRISRENLQNAQHYAARELIRGLAHEIKTHWGEFAALHSCWKKSLTKSSKNSRR